MAEPVLLHDSQFTFEQWVVAAVSGQAPDNRRVRLEEMYYFDESTPKEIYYVGKTPICRLRSNSDPETYDIVMFEPCILFWKQDNSDVWIVVGLFRQDHVVQARRKLNLD